MALRRFISGLSNPTLTSWEISKITRQTKSPCLALLPNNAAAYDLKDDLRIFAPQLNCFFLPGLETDLLRNRGPSLEKRTERIRFLSTWSGAVECPPQSLFMLTPEALCQPRPIGKFWKDFTLQIKVGQELSRTVLAEELATLGYLAAELVEQATHFAVRGSIVDVFTPVHEYPARVELFEDRVQSIRFFHPDSQRRLSELASLQIPPSREFIFPENEGAEKLRSKIRPLLDHLDWDKKDRDALLSRFQQQSFFPSVDYWAPLISSQYYPPLFQNEDWIQDVSAGPKGLFAETVVVIEAQPWYWFAESCCTLLASVSAYEVIHLRRVKKRSRASLSCGHFSYHGFC